MEPSLYTTSWVNLRKGLPPRGGSGGTGRPLASSSEHRVPRFLKATVGTDARVWFGNDSRSTQVCVGDRGVRGDSVQTSGDWAVRLSVIELTTVFSLAASRGV